MVFWIVEALAGWLEICIGFLFTCDILGVERRKHRQICIVSGLMTGGLLFINGISLLSFFAFFYTIAGIAVFSWMMYRKKLADCIVSSCCYFLILYSLDFLLILFTGIFTGNSRFGMELTAGQSGGRALFVVFAKGVLIVLYMLFRAMWKKTSVLYRKILPGVMTAVALSFILLQRVCTEISMDVIQTGIVFFLFIAMGIYLTRQYLEIKEWKLHMELIEEWNRVMMNGYQDMLRNYNDSQIFYHDLKNHLLTMENYLLSGKYDQASAYAASLQKYRNRISNHEWTGLGIVDFILNYKQSVAAERGICFTIDTDAVTGAFKNLSETDLCALFGNVLDNAIEGCEGVEGNGEIFVSVRNVRNTLMIKVVNSCVNTSVKKKGWLPASSKKEKRLHGWGMESIAMIMKKYQGTMQYQCQDGRFSVVLTFFF